MQAYLVILGEREAIAWVLHEQRMAFPSTPRREPGALEPGDHLFLYTTRGAWSSPAFDRGRVIGTATVRTRVARLDPPIEIVGREFHSGCKLSIDRLAPYREGLELQPLVPQLAAFPKKHAWSVYLRRPLLRLSEADAELIATRLEPLLLEPEQAVETYVAARSPRIRRDSP